MARRVSEAVRVMEALRALSAEKRSAVLELADAEFRSVFQDLKPVSNISSSRVEFLWAFR